MINIDQNCIDSLISELEEWKRELCDDRDNYSDNSIRIEMIDTFEDMVNDWGYINCPNMD